MAYDITITGGPRPTSAVVIDGRTGEVIEKEEKNPLARGRLERRVALHHLAFYRSAIEGLDLADGAERYLEIGRDRVKAKHTLEWIQSELVAAARRAKPHFARILRVPIERLAPERSDGSPYVDLEDYRLQTDPGGFYSEAELVEQYIALYPPRDRHAARQVERNERLRKKLQEALFWLEGFLPVDPLPDDPVALWLEEDVASRLDDAGIQTMAGLGSLIAQGGNWYSNVARIGQEGAARIEKWLSKRGLIPTATRYTKENPPAPATAIAPMERFIAPAALSGSNGSNRHFGYGLAQTAQTDREAIEAWLRSLGGASHTFRSYVVHAERFLLWMIFEKSKPLSSANIEDCTSYRDWLGQLGQIAEGEADGEQQSLWYWTVPYEQWVGKKKPRFHPEWHPFYAPPSPASQKLALTILGGMFEWLTRQRYLATNPWDGVGKITVDTRLRTDHVLTIGQWQLALSACADIRDELARARMRFLLLAGYSLGLRLSELSAMKVAKRVEKRGEANYGLKLTNDGWEICVLGKGRKVRDVAVPQVTMDALVAYMAARGINSPPELWPEGLPLVANIEDDWTPLTPTWMYRLLDRHFQRAAAMAPDAADAERLKQASTHWLRHSHATHALAAGVPIDVVQETLGHASQATTALYTHAGRRRRKIGAERLMEFSAAPGQ